MFINPEFRPYCVLSYIMHARFPVGVCVCGVAGSHCCSLKSVCIKLNITVGDEDLRMAVYGKIDTYEFDTNWDEYIERLEHFFQNEVHFVDCVWPENVRTYPRKNHRTNLMTS
jgi:hypothetical protein